MVRQFDKSKTIFKEWIVDTPKTCLDCILHDMQYWKIHRFTKPPEDIVNIENIFKAHAQELKDIYIQVSCRSNYPQVGMVDFGIFV